MLPPFSSFFVLLLSTTLVVYIWIAVFTKIFLRFSCIHFLINFLFYIYQIITVHFSIQTSEKKKKKKTGIQTGHETGRGGLLAIFDKQMEAEFLWPPASWMDEYSWDTGDS